MDETEPEFRIRVATSFDDIDAVSWSALGGASRESATSEVPYNPFVSHAFLSALENSGSATRETGWLGQHLLLEDSDGSISGALISYLKNHSQGEYVFDHGWADAFQRAGGNYYPKLQSSVPFTPATGPRVLVHPGKNALAVRTGLAEGLKVLSERHNISSAHVTFLPEYEVEAFSARGYLHRTDQQFHFINQNYQNYDDFLSTLASRKRKALKKERRLALANDISIKWINGQEITEEIWDIFFGFYMDTGSRKWGRPYLTREFFSQIGQTMPEDVLLIMAERDGRFIAGAINFIGGDCLYGRHWGCVEDHPYLHFEVCYHQAIDYMIEHGLKRVEAGAQGEHKLARGYVPVTTHSVHHITHPGLRGAVEDYLEHERRDVAQLNEILSDHAPYRKDG